MLQYVVNTAIFACELGLVAMSFNLSYRVLGFANFSHVEYVTIGGLVAVTVAGHVPIYVAGAAGCAAAGATSLAANEGIFKRLGAASVATKMIASAGAAIAIRGIDQILWGVEGRRFPGGPPRTFHIGGAYVTRVQVLIIVTAIVCVAAFALILRHTRVGRGVRAVANNPALAEARGISTQRARNQVCFIAGAIAGLAGVLLGVDTVVSPQIGIALLIPMFAACIVGGAGSPFGALIGAVLVSAATTLSVSVDFGSLFGSGSYYLGSEWKSVAAFSLLVLVLFVKPTGFFGPERERL
jgi:branched-subunit amino acid ABC-type transport system permease component